MGNQVSLHRRPEVRIYNKKDFKEKIKPFIDQENGKIQEKKKINSLTTKKIGSLKILPFFFLINSHLRGGRGRHGPCGIFAKDI